ncbi:MAG: hypothetical protein ACK4MV_07965 [Beijerinckiaceae bacterium]
MFDPAPNRTLEAAVLLSAQPALVRQMRRNPLPEGVKDILAGLAAPAGAGNFEQHRDALEYWVQEVMLFPGAPPHRVLGVQPGAARQEMRENMKLLMIWLHPDANQNHWRSAFAHRVLEAWKDASTGGGTPVSPAPVASRSFARTGPTYRRRIARRGPVPTRKRHRGPVRLRTAIACALLVLAALGVYQFAGLSGADVGFSALTLGRSGP